MKTDIFGERRENFFGISMGEEIDRRNQLNHSSLNLSKQEKRSSDRRPEGPRKSDFDVAEKSVR